ncbi:MAG: hypothetical protein Q6K80_08200 [Thermostichus sp. DG_1_6_bins_120]
MGTHHNVYPYRASSHFAGIPIEQVVICLRAGRLELFVEEPSPATALEHRPSPSQAEVGVTQSS